LISDETVLRVFDIASQNINNSWGNSKQKLTKFYNNIIKITFSNLLYGSGSDEFDKVMSKTVLQSFTLGEV